MSIRDALHLLIEGDDEGAHFAIRKTLTKKVRESIGELPTDYWIVLSKNDKAAWGPFKTYAAAAADLEKNHPGYGLHGDVDRADRVVYIERGTVDDNDDFHVYEA